MLSKKLNAIEIRCKQCRTIVLYTNATAHSKKHDAIDWYLAEELEAMTASGAFDGCNCLFCGRELSGSSVCLCSPEAFRCYTHVLKVGNGFYASGKDNGVNVFHCLVDKTIYQQFDCAGADGSISSGWVKAHQAYDLRLVLERRESTLQCRVAVKVTNRTRLRTGIRSIRINVLSTNPSLLSGWSDYASIAWSQSEGEGVFNLACIAPLFEEIEGEEKLVIYIQLSGY